MTTPAIERDATLELGLCTYLADLAYAIVRPDVDLQKLVDTHGAVVRVRRAGGVEQRWQLVARIGVEIYAATYSRAWETAEAVSDRLLASPYRAGGYLIDRAASESANAEQAHPNLRVVAHVMRLTTRDL
jgi:hypothetical protein